MSIMYDELRQAVRALARARLVLAASVACLSCAVGAATAIFTIVDGVILRPLPFAHGARLLAIWGVSPGRDTVKRGFSWPDVQDIAGATRSLDGVAALANAPGGMTLTGSGEAVQLPVRIVSGNFFEVLGVAATVGRTLTNADDLPASTPVVTLSDALWRQRFGADPGIVGQALTLDGRPFRVTGVAPRGFAYPPDARMWTTVAHGAPEVVNDRNVGWLEIVGRLSPGVTTELARSDLAPTLADLTRRYHPARGDEELSVVPLQRELVGDTRPAIWALFAAVLVLLAIACANVGGLLLLRGAARARDLAVRLALGATPRHLVRQALAESLVLLVASGAGGALLAAGLVAAVRQFGGNAIPRIDEVAIDGRVLTFGLSVICAATAVCALIPAWRSSAGDPGGALHGGGRGVSANRTAPRRILVVSEVALSAALMVAAGLVGQTFVNLRTVDVGFDADRVLAFDVPQPPSRYPTANESLQFSDRLLPRLIALPGVQRAASVLLRPLWGVAGMDWPVVVEGQAPVDAARNPLTNLEAVSPGYFATLGIPILDGRDLSPDDRAGRPAVAVVGRRLARRFWPDGRAIGRRLQFPLPGSAYNRQWFSVVGVVGDAKYRGLRGDRLDLYISAAQCPYAAHQFVARSAARPDALIGSIRAEVHAIDPDLAVDDVVVLRDAIEREVATPRLVAIVFVAFATTATALAALGLGTLMAWEVGQRTREIGIRIALGATSGNVVRMVMGEGGLLVGLGLLTGVAGAALATTFLSAILFGIAPHDPRTLIVATLVTAAVGLLSVYVPARRTSRVEPLTALRQE
ncbi:MAG TPA: ABC transporter permease [Vicinamibacterales bacterium]|jgi:putative ABC transport system permease protein|nr:ABC transporter permease [Vicinamibacterales bacterium]